MCMPSGCIFLRETINPMISFANEDFNVYVGKGYPILSVHRKTYQETLTFKVRQSHIFLIMLPWLNDINT